MASVLAFSRSEVFVIRRLLLSVLRRGGSRPALVALVALIAAAVVVPIAASRSTRSAEQVYGDAVRADGGSARSGLLSVRSRSVLAGEQAASARSLEFWARPRRSARAGTAASDRLSLAWGATRVRFRARLASRRFTHVVVEWGDDAIRLLFDGNLVEAVSVGAPSGVGEAHRVAVTGPVRPVDLRSVALYRRGLEVRSIRRHYRLGAGLFGRRVTTDGATSGPFVRRAAVPGNAALPAITGTAKDGQTLTSSNGTWSGSPTSYTRAWQRCDSAGANCAAISGATATTYLLTSADVGKTIRVKVTATNTSGSGNATSAQTAVVTAATPANTALPAITGTAKDGQTLTSTTGTWTGTTPLSYARQWRRCDVAGANCADISGATGTTYTLIAADVGATVKVVVAASNTAGNAAATSAATATVTAAAPANTAVPAISGTAKEGQLLTATTGTWTGSATITYSYQWQSCNASGASCVAISGATLSTYRLASIDVSKTVKVVVTATNGAGNAAATSAATAAITTGVPVNVSLPTATGTTTVGQTLTTTNGTWAGTATITYTRQWKRCNSSGASCTAISSATGTTYTLTSADAGSTIRVTWTATNGVGSATADTAATALVTAPPPANTAPPAITGTAKDGQTLTSTTGTWTGSPTAYARQWKRCDAAGANCSDISGATGTTYILASADVGSTIKVAVTATNSAGSVLADSAVTAQVTGSAPANTAVPTVTGTAKDGQTLTSTTGTWTGSATIAYSREWRRCDTAGNNCVAIADATGATYVVTAGDVGKKLRVAVTATNAIGTATAVSATTATVTALAPVNTALPTIGAAAKEGVRIDANVGTWTGSGPLTYTYQWQRCDAAGANCVAQWPAATDSWYRPWADDLGSTIRVKVTATNAAGSASATTAATSVVVPSAPVAYTKAHPVIDPSLIPPGQTDLNALLWGMRLGRSGDVWEGSPGITQTMRWMYCDGQGENCADVSVVTGNTIKLPYDSIGQTVRFRMTATNAQGTTSYVSDATPVIVSGIPDNVTPPVITGSPRNHLSFGATPGTWQGLLPVNRTKYFWQRCDADGQNCARISDDAQDEYEITDADVGHRLRVEERASYDEDSTNTYWAALGIATQVSAPSAVITDASTPPTVTIGGDLVADPDAWLDGDSYSLSVTATAAADTSGLSSVAVMYGGEVVGDFDGCDGASCAISHDLDIDTSESPDGVSALWIVATDKDHTQKVERRDIRFNRLTPVRPSHVLVDIGDGGVTQLSWSASNSPDVDHYDILRRDAPEEPFEVVGSTEQTSYLDQTAGGAALSAPLARMTTAGMAVADEALSGEEHVEYQVIAVDGAGGTSTATETVEATATDTPVPAPAQLAVTQSDATQPTQLTWDSAPGAGGYAVYRALEADADSMGSSAGAKGVSELVAALPATVTDFQDTPEITGRYSYTVRAVTGTGQLGGASSPVTTVLQATKIPPSQEVLDHARDVEALLEDGGATTRERIECATNCKAWRAAERALEKLGPSAAKIRDQLYKLRTRAFSLPRLTTLVSRAGAVATAGYVGWTIGTKLRKAYFTEKVPVPVPEIHNRRLIHGDEPAGTWACTPDWWNSACIGNGGTNIIGKMYAPGGVTVAVGRDAADGQILYETWNDTGDNCHEQSLPDPQPDLPGPWRWLKDTGPCPNWWDGRDHHWVPYYPVILGTPVAAPDDEGVDGVTIAVDDPHKDADQAVQALIDELEAHPERYAALIAWLKGRLSDGVPVDTADGIPSCAGRTFPACVTAFEHAGFAGPFIHEVLSPEEAWIGLPGGAVVDTTPTPDGEPDEDGTVIIRTNPDPMPEWTAEDEEIYGHITDLNPIEDNDSFIEVNRKNVARRCRVLAEAAALPRGACWTMPVMITGGLDAHGPAVNDVNALARHPRWFGVNRRPKTDRPTAQPWYYDQPGPGFGCLQSEKPPLPGCDEYPMWDWSQGKGGSLETETPNLRWTPQRENARQGRVWQHFKDLTNKGGATLPFKGCNIPVTPEPPTVPEVPSPLRDFVPPTFLAIPFTVRLMPSYGICNGTVTG